MPNIIILDMDNCISNDLQRLPLIRKDIPSGDKKYHDYHSLAVLDKPGNAQLYFREYWPDELKSLRPIVVISTARPEAWRTATMHWLDMHRIQINRLYMRPDDNDASAVSIKLDNLKKILADYKVGVEKVVGAYDDRPDIIQMYKDAGIKNAQVKFIHKQEY